eukprot:7339085-Prymnesium_polylepis.1
MTPPPKTPARRQRASVPTRATVGRASPIACSSGLSLVQGDFWPGWKISSRKAAQGGSQGG